MPTPRTASPVRWHQPAIMMLIALSFQLQGCRSLMEPLLWPRTDLEGLLIAEAGDVGEVIVYLEPLDTRAEDRSSLSPLITPIRVDAFSSRTVAVAPHQAVEFVIEDAIRHKLFSYDERNPFDLGLSSPERASQVVFHHPGLVHFYCSLHPSERGRILVAPSRHFAYASNAGRFQIADVRPGHYLLKTWGPETIPTETSVRVPLEADAGPVEIVLRSPQENAE